MNRKTFFTALSAIVFAPFVGFAKEKPKKHGLIHVNLPDTYSGDWQVMIGSEHAGKIIEKEALDIVKNSDFELKGCYIQFACDISNIIGGIFRIKDSSGIEFSVDFCEKFDNVNLTYKQTLIPKVPRLKYRHLRGQVSLWDLSPKYENSISMKELIERYKV